MDSYRLAEQTIVTWNIPEVLDPTKRLCETGGKRNWQISGGWLLKAARHARELPKNERRRPKRLNYSSFPRVWRILYDFPSCHINVHILSGHEWTIFNSFMASELGSFPSVLLFIAAQPTHRSNPPLSSGEDKVRGTQRRWGHSSEESSTTQFTPLENEVQHISFLTTHGISHQPILLSGLS